MRRPLLLGDRRIVDIRCDANSGISVASYDEIMRVLRFLDHSELVAAVVRGLVEHIFQAAPKQALCLFNLRIAIRSPPTG